MERSEKMDALERFWKPGETPTWLKESLETIAECYQNTRAELKQIDSHQMSEYHQQMFNHHYGLAIHMNNRYFLGKLDLKSTQVFLGLCLQSYDQIPTEDRDYSVDNLCGHVKELQEEVNEESDKLTASQNRSSQKEYIESCLALGSIGNNMTSLEECSEKDKKRLQQLHRCTQLVRLVFALEEEALGQTFQRVAIPAENETCLARAYHLVKHGKPSNRGPNSGNQIHNPDKEEALYGGIKERVRSTIYSEVVQHKQTLEQVKQSIALEMGQELSATDTAFIVDEYKTICLDQCLEEISMSMKSYFKDSKENDILNSLILIEHIKSWEEIPDYFKALDYHKELRNLSLSEIEEQSIVQHFKAVCLDNIDDFCDSVKDELDMLSCFKSYLSRSRNVKVITGRLGFTEQTPKVDFTKVLNLSNQENNEQLTELKCMLNNLRQGNQLIIEDKIQETIRSFMDPVQVKMVDGIVEVIGKHILLSNILNSVENELANGYDIAEVRFIGGEVFHIDADLENGVWSGKNIAVRSKLIMVHGTVVWDVSGQNCKHKFSPARSASTVGGDGSSGQDGLPGKSGGNVLILTEQMTNCELFTIISNGGDGGDGQDGGNGYKGLDGVGIKREELESEFKTPVRFLGIGSTRAKEAQRMIRSIERRFPICSIREINGSEIFMEASALDGKKITFSYCEPKLFKNYSQCYLVYRGSLGKPGGQGGDYGRGGQGGYPGKIIVKNIATGEIFNVQKLTTSGQDGRQGSPGTYGNTGNNGWDIGYLDYQVWFSAAYFGDDYSGKLTVTYHDDSKSESVWCWHKYKYASIIPANTENNVQTCHRKREVKRDRKQTALAVTKKTIVESSFVAKYDQHFNSVEENVLLKIYNRKESIWQRVSDDSTKQRKKASKRQKVHHIVSKRNIEEDIGEPLTKIPSTTTRSTLKATSLLSSNFKKDSMVNWKQLKHCRIEKSDLQDKFIIFESLKKENTKLSDKDLHAIVQILIDKYRLLAFEEFSDKFSSNNICADKLELASRYASICLEEGSQQSGTAWHCDLGTLDEYLFDPTNEKQQFQLASFCRRTREHFPPSVVEAFLVDTEASEDFDPSTYLNQYKFSAELQEFDSAILMEQFMKELIRSHHNSVLNLWYYCNEHSPLGAKLTHEIGRDYRLCNLRTDYMKTQNQKFDWVQYLQDDKFFETLLTTVVKKGPSAKSYRELLAIAFGINIQIYVGDPCGKLTLQDNHNPKAIVVVYLLLQNNSFFKLSLNENLMILEEDRNIRALKYSEISNYLSSLNEKRLIDAFMSDDFFLHRSYIDSNEVQVLLNTNLVEEIKKYFSFGERHTVEKLFTKGDVSNSVYSKLLRNMLLRFDTEGKHVSTDEIHFLVNNHLVASAKGMHEENIISWIVLAYPQQNWVREILLLNLERYFKELLVSKSDWRSYLTKVENKSILILLSAKLDLKKPENSLTVDKMDRILRLLNLSTIKPEALQKLLLPEWYYVLEEMFLTERLKQIMQGNSQKFKEASYYAVSLLNNYSSEMMEKFFGKLEQQHATYIEVVDTLWNIYNGRCILTEDNISSLGKIGLKEWNIKMKSQVIDYQERGIALLVQLILENKNASVSILKKMPAFKKDIQHINKMRGIIQSLKKKEPTGIMSSVSGFILKGLNRVNDNSPLLHANNRIKKYNSQANFADKSTSDKLHLIDGAIHEHFNFGLRNSQKLAVLTLLGNDRSTLAQVATGEGKSLIVVAVAIIKALQGQKVDIITSSSVLARRDAEQSKSIYAKFGIKVSHNCSEDIEKRKEAYSGNQVVYGDLSSFQRDYLLHKFYQKNVLGDRDFMNVIVDEVDSMLLDRGNNMLYLSHDLPDMDKLESVYVFIWQWVNNTSNGFDSTAIRDAIMWQIYGVVKPVDMSKLDAALSEPKRKSIWHKLVAAKIIDGEGKLITETPNRDDLEEMLRPDFSIYLDRLEYLLRECINREKCIHVPNYLRSFVELHLDSWIEAAQMALIMEAGHDYVVDVDRSGSSADRTPNITILDRDTGTDMVNSQWEAALHQFVQLKHGCKTYLQSLKAVFISNVTYFKLYKNLYGLSGTLGSHRERDLLGEIYDVDFVNIPTAKSKLFYEDVPIVCKSATEWIHSIIESTIMMTQRRKRSVLIICETLNDVTDLHKAFEGKMSTIVRTYTREYEEFDIGELPPGQIIIATNLAGRGTDIKITSELKKNGGVHVCLTYLPSNIRVEQQAFGRAARCGDRGSGQLIVLDQTDSSNIMQLKRERDSRELSRISLIKAYYDTRIVKEETCFKRFTQQYDELRKMLSTSAVTRDEEELNEILLSSCLDRWVYWLDKNGKNFVDNSKQRSRLLDKSLDDFLAELKSLKADEYQSLLEWVDRSIPRSIRLGRYFAVNKNRKLAHVLFDKVIAVEPKFSEAAYYYKAYALSTEIDMTEVDSTKIKTFSQLLRSAAHLFDERCVNLMANVSRIERLKTNLKNNILPINAYKEQKNTICKFYGALTQSIDAILGHPITGWSFEDEHTKKGMSFEIFRALLRDKIVQHPTLKSDITEKELKAICYVYGTSAAKLLKFLENCRADQEKPIIMEPFLRFFKEKMALPSREGFWKFLKKQDFLKDEQKYVMVNKTMFSFDDMQILNEKVSQAEINDENVTIGEGELLLYPDQLLNERVFNKLKFKKVIGLAKYEIFKDIGALSFQRKARLDINDKDLKTFRFQHYDSISLEDFSKLDITPNDANHILDLLVQCQVLDRLDKLNKDVYGLRCDYSKIKDIQLGPYKIYEEDVKDLLKLCFCYRIAFQRMLSCVKENQTLDITLMSKPHRRAVSELLVRGIIEPAKVSPDINSEGILNAVHILKLHQNSYLNVVQRLDSLKGSLCKLKLGTFSEQDQCANMEEWSQFLLNGVDLLLKKDNVNHFKIAFTFLWGAFKILNVLFLNSYLRKPARFLSNLSMFADGWRNVCKAFQMACNLYTTNYSKLKYNHFLKRVALLGVQLLDVRQDKLMRFAFEVNDPSKRDIQHVKRLAVPLIRGFDLVADSSSVSFLIEDRLKLACKKLSEEILLLAEKNETYLIFAENLNTITCSIGIEKTRSDLESILETHFKRQQYFTTFEKIFEKISESVLQVISKATQQFNEHKSVVSILSDEVYGVVKSLSFCHGPKLSMNVSKILQDLSSRLQLQSIDHDPVDYPQEAENCKVYVADATNRVKQMLREKLEPLFQQIIYKSVLEKGSFMLLNYAERFIELRLDTEEGDNASESFTKRVQIEKLKKESEKRRQDLAMTPVLNLLDQQFNEALARWERNATKLERLAVCIRKGQPVDDQCLELILDAVRFVLLRRTVVISNICLNVVTKNGTKKTYSSPLNFNGTAVDLHLIDDKFQVGITHTTTVKSTPNSNCLYDCLLGSIFELRKIPSKLFALEISQHLVNISVNKTNANAPLNAILVLNNPSTIRELCFAQYLQACFECPSRGVTAFGDLMERAKNGKKCARDWHGRGVEHVKVVSYCGSHQFVGAGSRESATTETIVGETMFDLRDAFLKIFL